MVTNKKLFTWAQHFLVAEQMMMETIEDQVLGVSCVSFYYFPVIAYGLVDTEEEQKEKYT